MLAKMSRIDTRENRDSNSAACPLFLDRFGVCASTSYLPMNLAAQCDATHAVLILVRRS